MAGDFLIARPTHEPIYVLLFVSPPSFWRNGVSPLLESLYPKAAIPFLTQGEIHDLLKNVQKAILPHTLHLLELSSKKRLGAGARKRFQSDRVWTDAEVDSRFREARASNVWFRSVSFDIVAAAGSQPGLSGMRGTLSKYGYFSCNGGFDLFEASIVRPLVQFAADRLKFFSQRDRSSTSDHSPRPIQIAYEGDPFKSSEQARKLVDALHRFKHGTCTVLHANPYVHLGVVDNIDYSSVDVWVLSQSRILVVPQLRTSEAALKRIVNHIFEHFREGRISEFQE